MKRIRLNREEKAIEAAAARGEYTPVSKREFQEIARSLAARRKDAILHIRINSEDLKRIKQKASKMGIKYQTFIAEIIHRAA